MTLLLASPSGIAPVLAGLDPELVDEQPEGTIYLLHLLRPYVAQSGRGVQQFQHYLGFAEQFCLVKRLYVHGTPTGARCLQVAQEAGIDWLLARTWTGDRGRERRLKNMGSARRRCPFCGVLPYRASRPFSAATVRAATLTGAAS